MIYVIKENRTYDQLFGDIREANGDSSLVMYGEEITPNQHKLARQFGILDNFYDSGEVSGNGHVWSTAAITSDYNEKTWQIVYRSNERNYDFGGSTGDIDPHADWNSGYQRSGDRILMGQSAAHNVTYRHYGEFVNTFWCTDHGGEQPSPAALPGHPPKCARQEVKPGEDLPPSLGGGKNPYQYSIPLIARNEATKPELREHFDPAYADFRVDFPDQFRADEFLREFAGFVQARRSGHGNQLPSFVLLRLPNDHTAGTRAHSPAPTACVADNDLALGRVVEALSNSPYWDDTAMFVLEDDAQSGADHVDAHRSLALVISKYSPGQAQRPFVDHHFYTTVNVVHTMEALLGLPPMNNNDARAALITPLFTGSGNQPAYKADYRNRDNGMIYQANAPDAPGAKASAKLNFKVADAANTDILNAILWRAAKGSVPMPAARHTVFPATAGKDRKEPGRSGGLTALCAFLGQSVFLRYEIGDRLLSFSVVLADFTCGSPLFGYTSDFADVAIGCSAPGRPRGPQWAVLPAVCLLLPLPRLAPVDRRRRAGLSASSRPGRASGELYVSAFTRLASLTDSRCADVRTPARLPTPPRVAKYANAIE